MEENIFAITGATSDSQSMEDSMKLLLDGAGETKSDPFGGLFVAAPGAPVTVEAPAEQFVKIADEAADKDAATDNADATGAAAKEADMSSEAVIAQVAEESASDNPLEDAFVDQDLKAAKPIFEKPAVFSYNGTTEDITDLNMTFEELRVAKASDFVALDDPKKVSWTVAYGKTRKSIDDPKKAKIGAIKKSIEMASGFLAEVKADKEKKLCCTITPTIKVQSKGDLASYKGLFSSVEEANASNKTICLIPDCRGTLFELRKTELGSFVTVSGEHADLREVRAGFYPALPRVPSDILLKIVSFFKSLMDIEAFDGECMEAVVNIYWDNQEKEYIMHVPKQTVAHASADTDLSEGAPDPERYVHYADVHSHNNMAAQFSSIDDFDEKETRVYVVIGELNKFFPSMAARISNGGKFHAIPLEQVFESLPPVPFDPDWIRQLSFRAKSHSGEQSNHHFRVWRTGRPLLSGTPWGKIA